MVSTEGGRGLNHSADISPVMSAIMTNPQGSYLLGLHGLCYDKIREQCIVIQFTAASLGLRGPSWKSEEVLEIPHPIGILTSH